jgi:hypothetical protein
MVQTIQAKDITLYDLEDKFSLQFVDDNQFFREWVDDLPEISDFDKQFLDRVKASYLNLVKYPPMIETTVKMVVLSPLLHLAGFYLSPFRVQTEAEIEISAEDGETIVKGKIDVLVLQQQFWIVVIESKRVDFSLEAGLAQALAYMLSNPHPNKPSFGLLTNGKDFQFIKLTQQGTPQYSLSRSFDIRNPGNDLYVILSILKRFAQILRASLALTLSKARL